MMQHHRAWRKTKRPTPLLQAPAEVDVVARGAKCGIEAAHSFKARLANRYIAAGKMLGNFICNQDVDGAAGRIIHAVGDCAAMRRRNIRAAHRSIVGLTKCCSEKMQPMWIRNSVVIEIRNYFAVCR